MPRVEPLSLDEAYLDVSHHPSGTLIAEAIKADIRREASLTASAGVSFNKSLAKLASDMHKPDGLTVIRPEDAEALIAALPADAGAVGVANGTYRHGEFHHGQMRPDRVILHPTGGTLGGSISHSGSLHGPATGFP